MKQDIIKIDGQLYKQISYIETWALLVHNYPEEYLRSHDDKYHKVLGDTQERCLEMMYGSYKEYDSDVVLDEIHVKFSHLIFEKIITKHFKSKEEMQEFFSNKERYEFTNEDCKIILKVKELDQRKEHHKELIETKLKIGRAIQRAINGSAGLPMDMC